MVLAVVAHQLHVELDHAFDPRRQVGETAGGFLGRHVGVASAAAIEAFDRHARVDLVGPVARAAAHQQPARSGVELPPVAGVSVRTRAAQHDAEVAALVHRQVVEVVGDVQVGATAHVIRVQHVERLLGDVDEARRTAETRDPVDAGGVDFCGGVDVIGVRPTLVHGVVPQRHEDRTVTVGVDPAQVALGEDRQGQFVHVLDLGRRRAVRTPDRQQVVADGLQRLHLVGPAR